MGPPAGRLRHHRQPVQARGLRRPGGWSEIRPPAPGEERTLFWDLPRFRDPRTAELVLATPRVGFFTTLAFFANWPTNASNASRVTANQALIVGPGPQLRRPRRHRAALRDQRRRPARAAGHRLLRLPPDPGPDAGLLPPQLQRRPTSSSSRPSWSPPRATFTVDGSPPVTGRGIATFARALAEHPRFAPAWTQKMCQFANSESCDPGRSRARAGGRRLRATAASTSRSWCASCSPRRWSPSSGPPGPRRPPAPSSASPGARGCAPCWRTGWGCPTSASCARPAAPAPAAWRWPSPAPPTAGARRRRCCPTTPTCSSPRPPTTSASCWPAGWWTRRRRPTRAAGPAPARPRRWATSCTR